MTLSAPTADERPRRFYKSVSVTEEGGGFTVRLDSRAARTPLKRSLTLPTAALAELVAQEWAAQGERLDIAGMAATRLACTVIDRGEDARPGLVREAARLAEADALCYFAEGPRELVARQEAVWGPWLDWAARELGVRLVRASGVVHQPQPAESLLRVEALAGALDDFALMGLGFSGPLYGSIVLAFAVQRGALGAVDAFEASRLDERFQEEQWGVDHEAAERTARLRRDAAMLQAWFDAIRHTM